MIKAVQHKRGKTNRCQRLIDVHSVGVTSELWRTIGNDIVNCYHSHCRWQYRISCVLDDHMTSHDTLSILMPNGRKILL